MIKLILLSSFLLFAGWLPAQQLATQPRSFWQNQNYEWGLSASSGQSAVALSAHHLYAFGKKKKFSAGFGLRFTGYLAGRQDYITAPARLTSGRTDPGVLFSETLEENLDTLQLNSAGIGMINAAIYLQYALNKKWDIGFNIDAAGFSFGSTQAGFYQSSLYNPVTSTQKAKPSSLNLLLVSDNDIGSLNSELYTRYHFKPRWGLKAGISFLFAEYRTEKKLSLNNDRFRNKALMLMLGISYCPYKKAKS